MKRPISVSRDESAKALTARWILVLLLALFASGWFYHSFTSGDRSGQDLISFILLGFVYGLLLAAWGLRELLREKHRFERLCSELKGVELGAFLAEREGQPGPLLALLRKLDMQARRSPNAVDAATLISLLHRRLSRTAKLVQRVGVLLVAGGMIGTCIGIGGMLSGLTEVVGSSDGKGGPEFMQGLFAPHGGPLSALASAYNTTLLGIGCGGVVLRALSNVLQDGVDVLADRYEEFICVNCRPAFGKS
ncbi:MAG: hypothetical protein V3W41_01625 [Planctomycetota bacterium]